ncbi:MAG: PPOX class F420-dependent oxidoreductase [bacterium]|nr:PPOX class F420-dependent oxidoreductase [bacterium]
MDIEGAQEFIRQNHRGVLVTRRANGSVQASPVLASVDGEGAIAISTRETARKVHNLRRDPRASYCGFTDRFYGDWLQIDGTAEVLSLPAALEPLVDYYRTIRGEHEDWDGYRAAMEEERRVLVRITIERVGPQRSG